MANIPTSVPQLDNLLNGGLQDKSMSCVWVKPGLDGTPFIYQIANSAAKSSKVFYITNSKAPASIQQEFKAYGFKSDKLNFIDSYSSLVGNKSKASLLVIDPKNGEEILNDIKIIQKKIKNPVIILDSLSTFIDLSGKEDTKFITDLKKLKVTCICLFTEWQYQAKLVTDLNNVFDNIIEISSVESGLFFRQYFGVSKLLGKKGPSRVIPYKAEKPEGIKIYIPKVLVTGPFNAGKTSFIHSSSEKAVSVDRLGTTIALDHGHVKYQGFTVDLFGTPGQQRFDPILKLLGGEAMGVVVVVSSTDPEGFPRAIEMMKKAQVLGLPVVFAANKANLRGALSPKQIKQRLNLQDEAVIPITAQDLTKVQPGLPCQLQKADIEKILDNIFGKLLDSKKGV
jgi:uncharacterized protein